MTVPTLFIVIFGTIFTVFFLACLTSHLEKRNIRGRRCPKCGTEMDYIGLAGGPGMDTSRHFICPHCNLSKYERMK